MFTVADPAEVHVRHVRLRKRELPVCEEVEDVESENQLVTQGIGNPFESATSTFLISSP